MPRLLLILLLLLSACRDTTGTSSLVQQLESEYASWKALGVQDYDVDYQQLCFCAPEATSKVTLLVRKGVLAAVLDASGNFVPADRWSTYKTIDDMFQQLISSAAQRGVIISDLTFDPVLHYPTHVGSDIQNVADGGYETTTSNLQRSPPATQVSIVPRDTAAAIQTDSVYYKMVNTPRGVSATVHFALWNKTSNTIGLANCFADNHAYYFWELQEQKAGVWARAFAYPALACASAPIPIAPGTAFRDSIVIVSRPREANAFPKFVSGYAEGVYRLVIEGYTSNTFVLDDPSNDAYSTPIK
jgi:hypothetical protein